MRFPPVDVSEGAGEYKLTFEAPGATRESMEVAAGPVPGTVAIKLEARTSSDGQRLLRSERGSREGKIRYERIVPVGWDADTANARSSLENGVLCVTVPRKPNTPTQPSKKEVA